VHIIHFCLKVDIQKPGKGSSKFIPIQLRRRLNVKTGVIAIIRHQGQQPIGRTGIPPGPVGRLSLPHNSKAGKGNSDFVLFSPRQGPLTFLSGVGGSKRVGDVIVHVGGVDGRADGGIGVPALPGPGAIAYFLLSGGHKATTGDAAHEAGDGACAILRVSGCLIGAEVAMLRTVGRCVGGQGERIAVQRLEREERHAAHVPQHGFSVLVDFSDSDAKLVFAEALLKHGLLLVIGVAADDDGVVVHAGEMGDGGGALLAQRQSLFDPDAAVVRVVRVLGVVRVAALGAVSAHGRQALPVQRSVCHGGIGESGSFFFGGFLC